MKLSPSRLDLYADGHSFDDQDLPSRGRRVLQMNDVLLLACTHRDGGALRMGEYDHVEQHCDQVEGAGIVGHTQEHANNHEGLVAVVAGDTHRIVGKVGGSILDIQGRLAAGGFLAGGQILNGLGLNVLHEELLLPRAEEDMCQT